MSGNEPGTTTPGAGLRSEEASSPSGRPRSGSGPASVAASHQTQLAQNQIEAVDYSRQPTIRIQRQSSRPNLGPSEPSDGGYFGGFHNPLGGRSRSNSEPTRRGAAGTQIVSTPGGGRHVGYMPEIVEGTSSSTAQQEDSIRPVDSNGNGVTDDVDASELRHARTNIGIRRSNNNLDGEYDHSMIDFLDVMGKFRRESCGWRTIANEISRPRSLHPHNPDECPELLVRPGSWKIPQSQTNIPPQSTANRHRV